MSARMTNSWLSTAASKSTYLSTMASNLAIWSDTFCSGSAKSDLTCGDASPPMALSVSMMRVTRMSAW